MALTATVFKAELQIADMDRGYYADHGLTLARHPSETDERMMVRLLAFALHAGEDLQFTKGLCADDEPELWQRSLSDDILLWIDVGLPDERRLRKACNRARQVVLYAYGGRTAEQWWQRSAAELRRHGNLQVFNLPPEATTALAGLVSRTMRLQCTIQEGQVWLGNGTDTVLVEPQAWQGA
ncbi:MAG: YaeQ family protein [Thiohalomonadaceae bacterium]